MPLRIVQRAARVGLRYLHCGHSELTNSKDDNDERNFLFKSSLAEVLFFVSIFLVYTFASSVNTTLFSPVNEMTENELGAMYFSYDYNNRRSLSINNLRGAENSFSSAVNIESANNHSRTRYTDYKEIKQLLSTFKTKDRYNSNYSDIECKWGDTHITSPKSPLFLTQYHKDTTKFLDPDFEFVSHHNCSVARDILYQLAEKPFSDLLDLVVIVSANTNIELLIQNWEIELRTYHTIFILDNSAKKLPILLPSWLKYEMHTVSSISSSLGRNGWVIGSSNGGFGDGASMISVGEWVSLKEYVYVILDSNKMSSTDSCLSILERHMFNILTPVIDDYRHCEEEDVTNNLTDGRLLRVFHNHHPGKSKHNSGSEKGIVSIRKTLMSLELNKLSPNLSQSHKQYFNVPLGVNHLLFKFNNSLLRGRLFANALLLFTPSPQSLYGGANFTEFVEAAQIISSWITKTYLDWIRGGVKVYYSTSDDFDHSDSYRRHLKPHQQHKDEANGLKSSVVNKIPSTFKRKLSLYDLQHSNAKDFVSSWSHLNENVRIMLGKVYLRIQSFNISEVNTQRNLQCPQHFEYPLTCYTTELIKYVFSSNLESDKLNFDNDEKSRYFIEYMLKLSTAWFEVWAGRKMFTNNLFPVAIQSYYAPKHNACAIITISHNEADLFPVWFRYYSRHFEHRDMFVLDHLTTDGSLDRLPRDINLLKFNDKHAMPVHERSDIIRFYQDFLLRQGYKCVVYTDVDEIIVPDPIAYPGGLEEYLKTFLGNEKLTAVKVKAYDLGHMSYGDGGKKETIEQPIEWRSNILDQRRYAAENRQYDKALITKVPLDYRPGFHKLYDAKLDFSIHVDTQLVMFHLSSFDKDWCMERMKYKASLAGKMKSEDFNGGYADHWKRVNIDMNSGVVCRYAISCLMPASEGDSEAFQIEGSKTKYLAFDNLGQVKMWRIPQYFRNAIV